MDQMEQFLDNLCSSVDVSLMPGNNDISSSFYPQQPFSPMMIGSLSHVDNLHLATNPHRFSISGVNVLGTAGQNIRDMMNYSTFDNELEALEATLTMSHIAPTAPDTLRCFPFTKRDPLIIEESPHIYYSTNCTEYSSKLINKVNGSVRLVTVPSFPETGAIVLVDIHSLESFLFQINIRE